ncbi:cobalt ABC transporter [Microbacterium testaceum]|uniref:Cobalt ABC transporter n=1 Tax=Microbacterium testaceum TaxID=2033 RepID=A0A147EW88_MICTE|nr:ABC transporter ATP-binding protein [Microbacterium testaceum]KTR93950.1 cobalt ABC transporter [Microbacterium testaceum]
MTPVIRVDDVEWTYPHAERPSLRGLDLTVGEGELVVLCGASGSGKSTALRLLNGLVPQFHDEGVLTGTVTVAGVVTTAVELDALGAVTGTVLQHPRRQFFTDSARDEVAFAMENLGYERERTRARVADALDGLAAFVPLGQSLQALSGGQQQQVAIASAAAHEPRVLLLDEPSSNLSVDAIDRLAATLAALKDAGTTIVIAEHRLRYLQDVLDRVVVMRDGAVDVVWTHDEFREISDETLAAEGLRGVVTPATLPEIAAIGASAASPAASVPGAALVLEGIRCTLGSRRVIDLDRAAFAAGEVTAIRGANGAGKSTLARIVTGLQRSAGSVRLDGAALSLRARQRASAVVMQDVQRQLFTETVSAEIALAGADAVATDADAVLASLDLDHLAERHPLSLSGGQQQRLVVAAVRVAGRRIVVFDEPSSGVDRRHLQSIADQIRRVAADGAVVLLISHDEDLLALAADRQLSLVTPSSATTSPPTPASVKEMT